MPTRNTLIILTTLCAALGAAGANAAVLTPDAIAVTTASGGAPSTGAQTDDVLLQSLSFGATAYDAAQGSFRAVSDFTVTAGRGQINAEYGDNDDGSDGDDNPFVKAGLAAPGASLNGIRESTDPAIQDAALLTAFNSLSLSEMTDGEGRSFSQFQVLFENSLAYDDVGGDGLSDIVFFERGMNDVFDVELIIGGTFESPVLSDALRVDSRDFWNTGIAVNTVEIGGSQDLGVGGFDLFDFGLEQGDSVYGFRLSSNDGPDLGGFFLSAAESSVFGAPLGVPQLETGGTDSGAAVPIPRSGWLLLLLGLTGIMVARARG